MHLLLYRVRSLDQSIGNQKGGGVANKNRYSASDAGNNGDAPRTSPKGSRQQCEHQSNAKFTDDDVPRRIRNHSATAVLPPMNSARHFFVERMLMAPSNPIISRPVLPKRSHKR